MPDFRPFAALRYAPGTDLQAVLAPPYDVLSDDEVTELHERDPHNICHIDVPANQDYAHAGQLLRQWVADGVLTLDPGPSLSVYRLSFSDATGERRQIAGVIGGLEVVDEGVRTGRTTVLPHERTTPKATTDRLDLTRATGANLSPVWGLSLADGLADALSAPGDLVGTARFEGVDHRVERVSDPERVGAIRAILASDDVLIADGHHRYSISRTYRDEVRAATGRTDSAAEQTLTFVSQLIEDQLSIEAIHRLYTGVSADQLRGALGRRFDFAPAGPVTPATLKDMVALGRLVVLWGDGTAEWLIAKPGAFDEVRALDGAWLEAALADSGAVVDYQHGLDEILNRVASGGFVAGILIRPTSIDEIRRTAREGLLMPPKSTFFTPKLRTGLVLRQM